MDHGFLEMLGPFSQMRILHTGRRSMLEYFFSKMHQGIGMPLFAVCPGFLGMGCKTSTHMITYFVTRISTRRFFARPASVVFGSTGLVSA